MKIQEIAQYAKNVASRTLAMMSNNERSDMLRRIAAEVRKEVQAIEMVNARDMEHARTAGKSVAFLDRMMLDAARIEAMAAGMEKVASLPDPIGEVMNEWLRPNGLKMSQVRVPIGVIGFIYESRPTVTCDAVALCIKSGNAVLLRGGSETIETNTKLMELIHRHVPQGMAQLIAGGGREEVIEMCQCEGSIDVIVPRGGKGLVRNVVAHAKMPVLKHLDGICHTYVQAEADFEMALDIVDDAKTQRPGVCNAMETLLVDRSIAASFLPLVENRMRLRGVELRACEESLPHLPSAHAATLEDWSTEYEDLILSVKVVDNMSEAIEHINHYGSHHSDAIITQNDAFAELFLRSVDSACVYHNCSTRFSDGEEYGFGAEIGIGTDKIHARGPMGLRELTSYQYRVRGNGQTKDPSRLL